MLSQCLSLIDLLMHQFSAAQRRKTVLEGNSVTSGLPGSERGKWRAQTLTIPGPFSLWVGSDSVTVWVWMHIQKLHYYSSYVQVAVHTQIFSLLLTHCTRYSWTGFLWSSWLALSQEIQLWETMVGAEKLFLCSGQTPENWFMSVTADILKKCFSYHWLSLDTFLTDTVKRRVANFNESFTLSQCNTVLPFVWEEQTHVHPPSHEWEHSLLFFVSSSFETHKCINWINPSFIY